MISVAKLRANQKREILATVVSEGLRNFKIYTLQEI
jgi:hypothetical protein